MIYDSKNAKNVYLHGGETSLKRFITVVKHQISKKDEKKEETNEGERSTTFATLMPLPYNLRIERGSERRKTLDDSSVIVVGNFGFNDLTIGDFLRELEELNNLLVFSKTTIYFVRNYLDDAKFFNCEDAFNFSNIIFVADYSVIETPFGNLLCVGGCTTADRKWRQTEQEHLRKFNPLKVMFSDNDGFVYNEEVLNELNKNKIKIHGLISVASPLNTSLTSLKSAKSCILDEETNELIKTQSSLLDKLVNDLTKNKDFFVWSHSITNVDSMFENRFFSKLLRTSEMIDLQRIYSAEMKERKKRLEMKSKKPKATAWGVETMDFDWTISSGSVGHLRNTTVDERTLREINERIRNAMAIDEPNANEVVHAEIPF